MGVIKMKEYNYEYLEKEMQENPKLKEQFIGEKSIKMNDRNSAQLINTFEFVNRYGKVRSKITGTTKLVNDIIRLPSNNFGSISELNIDTLPQSYLSRAGIEKTTLNQNNKSYKNKDLINRRFASKIVQEIGYINGVRYYHTKDNNNIVNMLCRKDKFEGNIHYYINGYEIKELILELINSIRNNNPKCFYEHELEINSPFNIDKVIVLEKDLDTGEETIVNRYIKVWKYPRFNMEYLFGLLKELNSGKYFMDVDIPIIYDLYKYPIRCTDINTKPLTDTQHNKNKDDYDISKYLWDDY